MSLRKWAALAVVLLGVLLCAQLPPSQKLSDEDEREFNKELQRLKALLPTANNNQRSNCRFFHDLAISLNWKDGIDVIDPRSGTVKPMIHPDDICLAFIDGLYAVPGSLVAIQNGPMLPRIVEFRMDANHSRTTAMRVLEQRSPPLTASPRA